MQEVTWSNKIKSRGRSPWLLFIKGDEVIRFKGKDIPGIAVIKGTDYSQCGKWSGTTYRLAVIPDVRVIKGFEGWETARFTEGLGEVTSIGRPIDTWVDVAEALGVSVPAAMEFLREWKPKAAERLDQVDQKLEDLDDLIEQAGSQDDPEVVVVSFGTPSNASIRNGFWVNPKLIFGAHHPGAIELIDPTKGWELGNIRVTGVAGTVISAKRTRGYHGGYRAISVAVAKNAIVEEEEEPLLEEIPVEELPLNATIEDLVAKFNNQGSG